MKTSCRKDETQPTYDLSPRIEVWATFVGGNIGGLPKSAFVQSCSFDFLFYKRQCSQIRQMTSSNSK